MNTTPADTTTRELTDREAAHLTRLYVAVENARTFTQSSDRVARLSAYQERLMDSGVPASAITAIGDRIGRGA